MNSLRLGMAFAAIVLGTMTAWAGAESAGKYGSLASGTAGYTVTVPSGERWEAKPSANGAVYENRVDTEAFYRAGFSAAPAPAFASRKDFLAYVKQAVAEGADTSRYATVQDQFTEKEQGGLWLVECNLNRNHWRFVDEHTRDALVTRIRTLYALDPREPGRVIVVWYAWHGRTYNESRFESEAATFLSSLRKTSQ